MAAATTDRGDLTSIWREMGIAPGYFAWCDGRCEARIFETDLDGEPGAEALVKLKGGYDDCRYVVFKREPDGRRWRVLGHVDHDFNRYAMSSHRVIRAGGVPFLVVRGQTGSGTGFSSYADSWYRVGEGGVRKVLAYDAEGHETEVPCGVGRELRSRILALSNDGRVVRVRFRVKFKIFDYTRDEFADLRTVARTVRFRWNDATESFEADEEVRRGFEFGEGDYRASYDLLLGELDEKGREALTRFEQQCGE